MLAPKNDRARPVTKLCLALETFRRTDEGRVRDASAFLGHFFPRPTAGSVDRLFLHMPKEVRADLLSSWGIRGKKSALRDEDEKVRATVTDALAAGDIDAGVVEEGVTPEILVDWVPLDDWWRFWRGSALPLGAVRKALAVGRELGLFDERWFLENLRLGNQKVTGTDVICAALSKDQIVAWLHAVHESGNASPAGLVAALGWETILAKTAHDALTFALDALARNIGLAPTAETTAETTSAAATVASIKPAPVRTTSGELPKVTPIAAEPAPATSATPVSPAPGSTPNARVLFGAPVIHQAPMRPPAATLSGVGDPPQGASGLVDLSEPAGDEPDTATFDAASLAAEDPAWAPPRAEPGDMGWDLVHGPSQPQPMPNNAKPSYNFSTDDEPTELPGTKR